jgi:hypothetical protein
MDMSRFLNLIFLATAMLVATYPSSAAPASTSHLSKAHLSHARRREVAPVNSRDPVRTAAAIAERYWGATPCGGRIRVVADSPLVPGLDPTTDGWVTFNSSLGPENLSAPPATYTSCIITLAHWRWASWTDMESDWGMFCLTVVHEMGHLLGHQHSLAPGSVMAPVFTSDANVPKLCNATWLPGWR